MRTLFAGALLLVACGGGSAAPKPSDPVDNTTTGTGAVEAFQRAANDLAKARGAQVRSWGTAELDEHPGPDYFAVIVETEYVDYLVEAEGQRTVIHLELDGKTFPWRADEGASPPPWEDAGDTTISHEQAWHAGFLRVELAIRSGKVVVLRDVVLEDARDDDTEVTHDYEGADGPCCPEAKDERFSLIVDVSSL